MTPEKAGGTRAGVGGGTSAVVITCEHGGNRVPAAYRSLLAGAGAVLASHRGWDPGALTIGRALARALGAPLVSSETTRLLVDLNRTENGAGQFSEFSRHLSPSQREEILKTYYDPHWEAAEAALRAALGRSRNETVFHIASHSFTATPGRIGSRLRPDRDYEVGLLYDPRRPRERDFVLAWRRAILSREPGLRVRLNQPYRGWTDSMPRSFRVKLGVRYRAVELECNQASLARPEMATRLRRVLISSLQETLALVTMGP